MPAEFATLVKEELEESGYGGFLQYDMERVYQTFTTNQTEGIGTAITAPGLPPLFQPLIVNGTTIWCVRRRPVRVDEEQTRKKWHVACTFTNQTGKFERDVNGNPTNNPTRIVPKLTISFREINEEVTTARLVQITKSDGTPMQIPNNLIRRVAGKIRGGITNSAGTAVSRQRRAYKKLLKYSFYARDWDSGWDDLVGQINSTAIKFKQKDVDGVRLTQTFPAKTLLLSNVGKDDIWREGKLYFRVTFELVHDELTWTHLELDKGTTRRLFIGQYKLDGTTYAAGELNGQMPLQDITTITEDGSESAIGEPVKFNGYGAEIPRRRPEIVDLDESFFLNFEIYEAADLAAAMGLN